MMESLAAGDVDTLRRLLRSTAREKPSSPFEAASTASSAASSVDGVAACNPPFLAIGTDNFGKPRWLRPPNRQLAAELLPQAELPWVLTTLPEDAVLAIVLHLSDHRDVVRFGACCKAFHSASEYELLWERLLWLNFKRATPILNLGSGSSWRQAYIEHIVIHGPSRAEVAARARDREQAGLLSCTQPGMSSSVEELLAQQD